MLRGNQRVIRQGDLVGVPLESPCLKFWGFTVYSWVSSFRVPVVSGGIGVVVLESPGTAQCLQRLKISRAPRAKREARSFETPVA